MQENENQSWKRFPLNAVRICIDQIADNELSGRIYSEMSEMPLLFNNCIELFLQADRLFEERQFPQAFQKRRSFRKERRHSRYMTLQERYLGTVDISQQRGRQRTFDVIVQTRKRAGWQGLIKNLSTNQMEEFQSELELLDYILQNYLTYPAAS